MASVDVPQEQQWRSAQSVAVGLDLIAAAKSQLRFLAAVDSHPHRLYHGPALKRAIQRYENCWLPLLAEHGSYSSSGLPFIPPLDCAWIWHCHRLNPVQYIKDCESHYGKLLDARETFADDDSEAINFTQQLWDAQYPDDKYEISSNELPKTNDKRPPKIAYDLEAAAKRQSSFYYQVSRAHMGEESFLNTALQRYKGYLYLLKLSDLKVFLVPTYDIDLMWHSHQDSPRVYREDMMKLLGKVLNHDDTDSDRSEGQKLDTGFNRTREFWQQTFGMSYERAGAMYRGEPPAPIPPFLSTQDLISSVEKSPAVIVGQHDTGVQARETMEVFVTVHRARNVHTSHRRTLAVRLLFQEKCSSLELETPWIGSTSDPEWKCFWAFQCEAATEGVRLELWSQQSNCFNLLTRSRLIGYVDISWQTLLNSPTLSWDGWVPLLMRSKLYYDCKPTSLWISASITPPVIAPYLLRIESPLVDRQENCLSRIVFDHANKESLIVKIRGLCDAGSSLPSLIQVYRCGYTDVSDNSLSPVGVLGTAKLLKSPDDKPPATMMTWSLFDDDVHLVILNNAVNSTWDLQPDVHLKGILSNSVRLLQGRKLQYEVDSATEADEAGFITLVHHSPDALSGKATALFNWRSGIMEVSPEESGILVLLLCTIIAVSVDHPQELTTCWGKKSTTKRFRKATSSDEWGSVILNGQCASCAPQLRRYYYPWYNMGSTFYSPGSGCGGTCARSGCAFGSGCGGCGAGGCGNQNGSNRKGANSIKNGANCARGGGCGGCGSGGCGNNTKNGANCARGGGCGGCGAGGCGNSIKNGANHVRGGGCGGCGAGGCGNCIRTGAILAQGGGCGGCGAGGCGNSIKNGANGLQGGGCGGCGAGGCGNFHSAGKRREGENGSGGGGGGGCGSGCGGGCGGGNELGNVHTN